MSEARHRSEANTGGQAGNLLGSAFLKEAELLIGAQNELLNNVEDAVQGWVQRQREALDNSARSFARMYECRNIVDLMQVQQQFVTDCLHWMATEMRAIGKNAAAATRTTVARAGEAVEGAAEEARHTAKAARETAQRGASHSERSERAAA